MREKLQVLLKRSYSPYYHFPVSCIVKMNDGSEFSGVNVENANGTSICAERNAIASAICAGYQKGDFNHVYLMLSSDKIGWPCFACRQVLLEFLTMDTPVTCYTSKEEKSVTLKDLCPYPFDDEDLL